MGINVYTNGFFRVLTAGFLFWACFCNVVHAQQPDSTVFPKEGIEKFLPPLSVLIDSALNHNAYVQYRDLGVVVERCKLKASKIEWTRNLGLQANYGYGNLYYYSTVSTGGIEPPASVSNRSEIKYSGAVYLSMPFYTIANRRNQIRLSKAEYEQAQWMSEHQREETRMMIIRQYNDVILKHRVFRIKSAFWETARINFEMVEKEFLNGVIPIAEYSRLSDATSRAQTDFETSRTDFVTAFMILEEMVGFRLNLIK